MEDIDIARKANIQDIRAIANKANIPEKYLEQYGKYKAKISDKIQDKLKEKQNGKLILVTAINPTPLGEGKTTVAIGLADGLSKIGRNAILALREPSLGPVFGIKGGATGGGYAQITPMEDINLHFNGDIHAITSANNLLSAMIDNHIYSGNDLEFQEVTWKRCIDLNDRQLRKITCGLSGEKNIVPREDGFDISVASEIMAILCLSNDIKELKVRLGNIIVGYNKNNKPIFAQDLKADGSMAVLLKDAIKPNIVQTLENTPTIIHGGPFANIAHGCNSIIATKLALKLADYTVTEAGFGADLGAEKFLNIKCRELSLHPDAVVCVATIKALKYHGGMDKKDILNKNMNFLKRGISNLQRHIDNLKNKFGLNVIVAINKFNNDCQEEINFVIESINNMGVEVSLVESWAKGAEGSIDLAQKIVKLTNNPTSIHYTYELRDSIIEKIKKVANNIYGAEDVEFSNKALDNIKLINKLGYNHLPICIAKTQYSFSDDPHNLECIKPFNIKVENILLKSGAGFIVVITGKILTMPGLPKKPAAEDINIDQNGNIVGIF